MKKVYYLLILLLLKTLSTFSQTENVMEIIEKKSVEITENLDLKIKSIDLSASLTNEQKAKLISIHKERLNALNKLGYNSSIEQKKESNKIYYSKIFKEILTVDQKKILKKLNNDN